MVWRAVGMASALVLAGCGSPWLGDETVVIAPTSVAEAQLQPAAPDQIVVVAAAAQATTPTEVLAATGETGAPANRGAYVVSQTFVADAALMPVATGVSSDVARGCPMAHPRWCPCPRGPLVLCQRVLAGRTM